PRVGEVSVILDGRGEPACAIETTAVARMRFSEVDQAFAFEEGEDDRTLASWRTAHRG
ncbi:ASCH domain-containing protein, partial [Enterobacter hormaechei]|uniref:ASCH domain-containing protein n=1 Tax=Enterobacter hormaechei TaxID=158836 RepID=UPI0013D5853A